jgi:hypothetical protein
MAGVVGYLTAATMHLRRRDPASLIHNEQRRAGPPAAMYEG